MKKNGIFIGVYKNCQRYVLEICTTNDLQKRQTEAKRFSQRTGVNQVYWFQKYPLSLDANDKEVVSFVIKNGFLVYSDAKDE